MSMFRETESAVRESTNVGYLQGFVGGNLNVGREE